MLAIIIIIKYTEKMDEEASSSWLHLISLEWKGLTT